MGIEGLGQVSTQQTTLASTENVANQQQTAALQSQFDQAVTQSTPAGQSGDNAACSPTDLCGDQAAQLAAEIQRVLDVYNGKTSEVSTTLNVLRS